MAQNSTLNLIVNIRKILTVAKKKTEKSARNTIHYLTFVVEALTIVVKQEIEIQCTSP